MENLELKLQQFFLHPENPAADNPQALEELKQTLVQAMKTNNQEVVIYHAHTGNYQFVRQHLEECFHLESSLTDLHKYMDLIHPHDREYVLKGQVEAGERMHKIAAGERLDHKLIFECRLKDHKGKYRRIFHQYSVIQLDEEGRIKLILLLLNEVGEVTENTRARGMTIVNCHTGKRIPLDRKTCLSPAELGVLKLMTRGNDGTTIAKKLHISVKTTESHRANIFYKLDVHNAPHAAFYGMVMGAV